MRRLIAYLLLIVTILMTLSACEIPGTGLPDDGPPIPVTEEAAASFEQKSQVVAQEAQATGTANVNITQEEITSFIALRMSALETQAETESGTQLEFPLVEPQIYFKDDGQIVVRGRIDFQGVNQPIRIAARPTVVNGTLELEAAEGRIGPVPVPGAILDAVDQTLTQAILGGQDYGQITNLQVSGGSLTFSGQRTQ